MEKARQWMPTGVASFDPVIKLKPDYHLFEARVSASRGFEVSNIREILGR